MMRLLSLLLVLCFSSVTQAAVKTTILILGDSLSAGYQMPIEQSWPSLLPKELQQKGIEAKVINGSISGDTTGNGLQRLPSLLKQHQPDWVLIELGANDGLRGFPPTTIQRNLNQLIEQSKQAGSQVALMQIMVPPNYGKRYTQAFSNLYPEVAKQQDIPLLPFFLENVIIKPEWMMKDGLHPKADAQPWIAQFMASQLQSIL
ncbi:multifunctional acyl-CoA thioesterase I/protease I/lysophospholipase L1 [Vibrio algivorus]|uniref:Multifunctional acyl-CoA thioesterase I/protease I/lysophospholipase L1 n=1 Tax=Vibrio algivorus TaxID=1667024 RepID=A0A557P783_9VIBR|nr:multifunctional acyl-CoA thioesterase I/protease I/lysophospholipase L1 [Vibrio algivorus]TVO36522.1 multifunctional acyl-CoA thioesterase I/protease I/lysophospholipase L1 [Vibrio algivorus]